MISTIFIVFACSCNKKCGTDNMKFQAEEIGSNKINFYLKHIAYSESKIHLTDPSFILEVHNLSGETIDLKKELNDVNLNCSNMKWNLSFYDKGLMQLKNGDKIFVTMVLTKMIDYDHQLELIECLKNSSEKLSMSYSNESRVIKNISRAKDFTVCIDELSN